MLGGFSDHKQRGRNTSLLLNPPAFVECVPPTSLRVLCWMETGRCMSKCVLTYERQVVQNFRWQSQTQLV